MEQPALFLLDSYAIIYRSYYAFMQKPLRNARGENVSAVFGFFRFLFQIWEEHRPEAFVAVFDSAVPTFRHERYEAYKANRQKAPEDLHSQVPLVEEALALLGVPLLRMDRYEADDIIATLAERCRAEGRRCVIISGDKDLLQLVGGCVEALRPDKDSGYRRFGPAEVEAEWGIPPERILDYLSLTGDSSDNIPGVPGIGDKTALKLLSEFGTLEAVYRHITLVKPEGTRKKLVEGRESAELSRELITLEKNVPLDLDSIDRLHVNALNREAASALFLREGMRSLATAKPDGISAAREKESPSPAAPAAPASVPGLLPSLAGAGVYETVLDPARFAAIVAEAAAAGVFAFDCETDGLDELSCVPVGFSLSTEPRRAAYVPVRAPGTACIPEGILKEALSSLLGNGKNVVVGQNLKFDIHVLENWGVAFRAKPWDTMIAAWLLDSERDSLSLSSLAESRLGYGGIPYAEVAPKGTVFSDVALDKAAPYAAEDADFALRLSRVYAPELEREGLASLFADVEMPLLSLLARIERTGVLVDAERLESYGKELDSSLDGIRAEVYALVGHEFNINSTKQLQEVLFTERKLAPTKKTSSGFSTDVSVLEELAREDPVPALILRHRTLQKLKSTYVDALVELSRGGRRVHTHFMQAGTATGRLSSRDPNLQNIPVREEEGRRIRSSFVAPPGRILVSADYSQIELVVFAELSGDENLKAAFREGVDIHRKTAASIFGVPDAEVTQEQRRAAKTINFGVIYGMGAFRLSGELGIPRAQAQKFIDAYFARYPGVSAFIESTIARAREEGCVRTILGRKRPARAISSRNANERQAAERAAVNTPIQGSAADIVKLAMLRVDAALARELPDARIILQVHDELIVEAAEKDALSVAAILEREMSAARPMSVPLRVGVETAQDWGGMH